MKKSGGVGGRNEIDFTNLILTISFFYLFFLPNKFYTGSDIPFLSKNEKEVIPKQDEGKGIEGQKSTS